MSVKRAATTVIPMQNVLTQKEATSVPAILDLLGMARNVKLVGSCVWRESIQLFIL